MFLCNYQQKYNFLYDISQIKHYLETYCRSQKVYLEFPVLRLLCDVQLIQQIGGKAGMFWESTRETQLLHPGHGLPVAVPPVLTDRKTVQGMSHWDSRGKSGGERVSNCAMSNPSAKLMCVCVCVCEGERDVL